MAFLGFVGILFLLVVGGLLATILARFFLLPINTDWASELDEQLEGCEIFFLGAFIVMVCSAALLACLGGIIAIIFH